MKRNFNKYVILCAIFALSACGSNKDSSSEQSSSSSSRESSSSQVSSSSSESSSASISKQLEFSELQASTGTIYTDPQLNYLNSENYADTTPYNGNMSVSAPKGRTLSWNYTGNFTPSEFIVNIYNDQELQDCIGTYSVETTEYTFFNEELDKTYYWNVSAEDFVSETASFTTGEQLIGPRNLYIDGVENARDLGGWTYFDEDSNTYRHYMKQGMIYRSGRFNKDKEDKVVSITEKGLYEVKQHLKFKTEIDLRRTSTNEVGGLTDKSVLGDDVNYVQLPMVFGGNNILTFKGEVSKDDFVYDNPARIKDFFEILAVEDNYPINFHCSIGKDRTGCLAYLIEGLLGFDQETMYRDYMFTNFANAGMCKLQEDILNRYGRTISDYDGDTVQEKVYKYLNEVIGVSTTDLDSVINILKLPDVE